MKGNQLDQVALNAGNGTPAQVAEAKAAGEAQRRFMGGLGVTGSMIEVVGDGSGFGPIKMAGKGIKAVAELAKGKPAPSSYLN